MLRRGEQNSLFHQAGGIADASDIVSLCLNGKIVEVRATKNNSRVGGSRKQADASEHSGVKTHTFSKRLFRYSGLEHCPSVKIACCLPWFSVFVHIFQ